MDPRPTDPAAVRDLQRRHRDFYLELAEEARVYLEDPSVFVTQDRERWLDALDIAHDNTNVALQWSLDEGDVEEALRLVAALSDFWIDRRFLTEGQRWFERALEAREGVEPALVADALHAAGLLAFQRGDHGLARSLYDEELALRRERRDDVAIFICLRDRAWVEFMTTTDVARASAHEVLDHARRLDDPLRLSEALNLSMWTAHDDREALEFAAELREVCSRLEPKGWFTGTLANRLSVAGDHAGAVQVAEEGVRAARTHRPARLVTALSSVGEMKRRMGDLEGATQALEEALQLARQGGQPKAVYGTLTALAQTSFDLGRYGTVEILAEEGIEALGQMHGMDRTDRWSAERLRRLIGNAKRARGDLLGAREVRDVAVEAARAAAVRPDELVDPLTARSSLAEIQGDIESALADMREILLVLDGESGEAGRVARSRIASAKARIAFLEERWDEAIAKQAEAVELSMDQRLWRLHQLIPLAEYELVAGRVEDAVERFTEALRLAEAKAERDAQTRVRFAEALRRSGDVHSAREQLSKALDEMHAWPAPEAVELVEAVARLATDEQGTELAARLLAAADAARERMGMPVPLHEAEAREALIARLREIGDFDEMWTEGSALTLDDARTEAAAHLGP